MNELDTATLLWGVLFGSIGVGYFMYGRKQRRTVPFLAGIGLVVLPYFITNIWLMVAACVLLMLAPMFIKV